MNKLSSANFQKKIEYICKLFNDQHIKYIQNHEKYAKIDKTTYSDRLGMINFLTENFVQFASNNALRKY